MSHTTDTIPSICIPRAFSDVTEKEVQDTFDTLFGVGTTREIDMVLREDYNTGELFWVIFVHFNNYMPTLDAPILVQQIQDFKRRIESGSEVRIQHRAPYFWKSYKVLEPSPPDFENEEWEPVPENIDELDELCDRMLATAPENCR